MSVRRASVAAAGALFAFSGPALAVDLTPPTAARITADVTNVMQRYTIPGATVLIARDGHIVYVRAFGSSDLAAGAATRDDTHYEIGSITKQFTAAAILQLHEAGKVDIDAKVAVYVPDAPYANEITVRQLLTQTSGLRTISTLPASTRAHRPRTTSLWPVSPANRSSSRPAAVGAIATRTTLS
jgi:D-alanyl-D-alanine carboxypeptidase